MGIEVLVPIFGIMVVLVPIVGITMVLTLRLGGKPFVETLARELRSMGFAGSTELEAKVADLSDQVESLSTELYQLREAQSFERKLLGERSAPADVAGE